MNNQDFRQLFGDSQSPPTHNAVSQNSRPQGASLGSRLKSSVPMTPRNMGGNNQSLARQMADNRSQDQPTKKFRAMAVPRGVKLAAGYQDRASARAEANGDEREARIQALEEQVKLGQIDQSEFERIRDEITAGDVAATHLVKGLDKKLLERVRRGEDVFQSRRTQDDKTPPLDAPENMDEDGELEQLEQREVVPIKREHVEKKGELAPVAGVKRSRNDILAELKAQRHAAAEAKAAAQSQTGSRFKRFGEKQTPNFTIERDEKGREVLITVDENGKTKRKVRKVPADTVLKTTLPMPDPKAKPLGIDVDVPLPIPPKPEEEEIDDIFEGVGDSYDPLGAADGEDGEDSSDSEDDRPEHLEQDETGNDPRPETEATPDKERSPASKRNYFNDAAASAEPKERAGAPFQDPEILAALRRAAVSRHKAADDKDHDRESGAGKAKSTAADRLLGAQRDRDLDDIDMGFGGSRGGDEEDDEEGGRIKLSQWKGNGADDANEHEGHGGKPRKRGKKKRKGDKNSAADIMRVIEGRK